MSKGKKREALRDNLDMISKSEMSDCSHLDMISKSEMSDCSHVKKISNVCLFC